MRLVYHPRGATLVLNHQATNWYFQEKRTTVLAAAGRVGDFSQQVINTMDEPTHEQSYFHDHLVQKAKNVATSTAQLVLRYGIQLSLWLEVFDWDYVPER